MVLAAEHKWIVSWRASERRDECTNPPANGSQRHILRRSSIWLLARQWKRSKIKV